MITVTTITSRRACSLLAGYRSLDLHNSSAELLVELGDVAPNRMENTPVVPAGIERRRYTRHRLIVDLNISSENGTSVHGMSFGISVGGMSAATQDTWKWES